MAFSLLGVTLDTDIMLFWVLKAYHLAGLVPPFCFLVAILSAWGHCGGSWEQQDSTWKSESRFSMIWGDFGLGPHFASFLCSDELNSVFFRACAQVTFACF